MAKKKVAIHIPTQQGFGFEVCDVLGRTPAFLGSQSEVLGALDLIEQSLWSSVDVETTGLTDASSPVPLAPVEIKQGASNVVRMRTIQVRVPTVRGRCGPRENFVFDCDKMGPSLTQRVAQSILTRRMFIAHNAGFDLYWLRRAQGRLVMPEFVVDTMLMTRLLNPKLVLRRAEMISHIKHKSELAMATPQAQAAWKSLISGASGGSLADVTLALFDQVVDKKYQKPNNWTGLLGFEHWDYAVDDVVLADRILCNLLGLDDEGDLLTGYLGRRARQATVRLIEPQVPELVLLRENGMPVNEDLGVRYVAKKRLELADRVNDLIEIEPALEEHRIALSDPDTGLDDSLKSALAAAFESRGVLLRRTAATNAPQVGEKDLRACRAAQMETSRPLFNAWGAVCRSKKTSAMALDVVGYSQRSGDHTVRSLMSHGPVTGRLSASEPNCFTGDTEILTESGWTRFDELKKTAKVAQYEEGFISFVAPTGHIEHNFTGDLVLNQSTTTSLLSTPDHRCLLINLETGKPEVHAARDYPKNRMQLHAGQHIDQRGLRLTRAELRFLVAAQSIGNWDNGDMVFRCANASDMARLGEILEVSPSREATGLVLRQGTELALLAKKYLGHLNEIGGWVLDLSQEERALFIEELSYWVGSLDRDFPGESGHRNTRAMTPSSANWVQIAFTLSNVRAYIVPPPAMMSHLGFQQVHIGDGTRSSDTSSVVQAKVAHSGKVYCVTVPSSFIVVRREGKTMVTGNCQQWPRDQLFRAMCISPTRPGCETMEVVVTDLNLPLVALVADVKPETLAVGDTVTVDTVWMTGLFWSDKKVPDWPSAEREALNQHINDQFENMIVASDFGALDVRVGAALCIRSQREMINLVKGIPVPGEVQPADSILTVLQEIVPLLDEPNAGELLADSIEFYAKKRDHLIKRMEKLKEELDNDRIARRTFFQQRSETKEALLAAKLGWRLSQCFAFGVARGEREYSALRDAFVIGLDIHTFTGMKLMGRDPLKEFEGLSKDDRVALERKLKKELGPRRQQGKIANLSLLYGMADAGFQEAAARGYDEHWTLEQTHDIRNLWMDAYPEVELWHLWTECLQAGFVYVPDGLKDKPSRTGWWLVRTLGGRDIVAFGLNAALSYQDQSSGADILGMIMHKLHKDYRPIFDCSINQVHDEQVFCWPMEKHEEYLPIVEQVMVGCADELTMPYGVPCAVSPASGPLWVKD